MIAARFVYSLKIVCTCHLTFLKILLTRMHPLKRVISVLHMASIRNYQTKQSKTFLSLILWSIYGHHDSFGKTYHIKARNSNFHGRGERGLADFFWVGGGGGGRKGGVGAKIQVHLAFYLYSAILF